MSVDRVAFRDMMSRFGVAVSVITTDGAAGQCGFTCTAVCSVTDEPPTILVCLNRKSQMNAVFRQNGVLCVNVLSAEQEDLSATFAGRRDISMADRFAVCPWDRVATGAPALRHVLADDSSRQPGAAAHRDGCPLAADFRRRRCGRIRPRGRQLPVGFCPSRGVLRLDSSVARR